VTGLQSGAGRRREGGRVRIKVTPGDFVVTEIVNMDTKAPPERSRYRIYLLEKWGWNTLDAISSIADASRVQAALIGYAGLKDRHARTSQHISVPARYELVSRRDDIRLTFLGFSDDFVSTKVLVGNRFRIRVGGLTGRGAESMSSRAREIRKHGFPNYFDDQRFGSVTPAGDFVAERMARGHLKGALKIHLSEVFPTQKKAERDRRARVAEAWGKWDKVFGLCESEEDRAVAAPLLGGASKKNLLLAINAVPHEAMTRYIAAYQAFIWNEVLRRIVTESGVPFHEVPGKAGPYLFPVQVSCGADRQHAGASLVGSDAWAVFDRGHDETGPARREAGAPLDGGHDGTGPARRAGALFDVGLEIPTVAARLSPCRPEVACEIDKVLSERGLALADFNIRGLRSRYFKSFSRRAWVIPDGLVISVPRPDRENPSEVEVRVSFALPAGSYATMLLKALTVPTSPQGRVL
jgi:tRNA pseudouridine13 synthase